MKRSLLPCFSVLSLLQISTACNEKGVLPGQGGGAAVQVMAYGNKAAFPECSAASKGLMTYNMEDGKFYICNGSAFDMANSVAS